MMDILATNSCSSPFWNFRDKIILATFAQLPLICFQFLPDPPKLCSPPFWNFWDEIILATCHPTSPCMLPIPPWPTKLVLSPIMKLLRRNHFGEISPNFPVYASNSSLTRQTRALPHSGTSETKSFWRHVTQLPLVCFQFLPDPPNSCSTPFWNFWDKIILTRCCPTSPCMLPIPPWPRSSLVGAEIFGCTSQLLEAELSGPTWIRYRKSIREQICRANIPHAALLMSSPPSSEFHAWIPNLAETDAWEYQKKVKYSNPNNATRCGLRAQIRVQETLELNHLKSPPSQLLPVFSGFVRLQTCCH